MIKNLNFTTSDAIENVFEHFSWSACPSGAHILSKKSGFKCQKAVYRLFETNFKPILLRVLVMRPLTWSVDEAREPEIAQ